MSDSALSKMLIFDFFQVSETQAKWNKLDPSTSILPLTAWWKGYSMLTSPFWFRTKQFRTNRPKSMYSSCKKQKLASKWCQKHHEKCMSGEWTMTNAVVGVDNAVFCLLWYLHATSGLGAPSESSQPFWSSGSWAMPALCPASTLCPAASTDGLKESLSYGNRGIYLGALWVTSWWNKLGVPCCHSGLGFSVNLKLKNTNTHKLIMHVQRWRHFTA